jgi:hypothetical protein
MARWIHRAVRKRPGSGTSACASLDARAERPGALASGGCGADDAMSLLDHEADGDVHVIDPAQ